MVSKRLVGLGINHTNTLAPFPLQHYWTDGNLLPVHQLAQLPLLLATETARQTRHMHMYPAEKRLSTFQIISGNSAASSFKRLIVSVDSCHNVTNVMLFCHVADISCPAVPKSSIV